MSKTPVGHVAFPHVSVVRESDRALLVRIDGDDHWIPKSHIHDDSEVYAMGTDGELIVSEWIATEKRLV